MSSQVSKESLKFLKDLSKNNDRDWFAEHKPRYQTALSEFKDFIADVETGIQEIDEIEKTKVFRVYRDVRFSKDKSPYKSFFSASFTRAGKYRRGGLYLAIEPDKAMVGGGFWGPESKDLKFIREGIIREEEAYRQLIEGEDINEFFGGIEGNALKTAPRGFDKQHPAVDLIRNKQYLLMKHYDADRVVSLDFASTVVSTFRKMLPYFNFMSELLVFDENGIER